jgi:hypothetical protein
LEDLKMILLDEGLVLSGRATCGMNAGYISKIERRTYTIRWLDGEFTTQLRPDLEDDKFEQEEAA